MNNEQDQDMQGIDTSRNRGAHSAKYLVLLGPETAPRALLFSGEHRYLTEMFDEDGLMVDNLIRTGFPLRKPPNGLTLDPVLLKSEPMGAEAVRCFALGAQPA
jgi:hypothetical protein